MKNIRHLSAIMKRVAEAGMVILLLVFLLICGNAEWFGKLIAHQSLIREIPFQLSELNYALLILTSALLLFVLLFGMWHLRGLFVQFQAGQVFSLKATQQLYRFAVALTIFSLARPIVRTLNSVLLTMNNPQGKRQLVLTFSNDDYLLVITGFSLVIIAYVFREAMRIDQENKEII